MMGKGILIVLSCLAFLIAVAGLYLSGGFARATTQVDYRLLLDNPAVGYLEVEMTISPGRLLFLDLFLRDPILNGSSRISDFSVMRGGKPAASWNTLFVRPDLKRLWLGFSRQPLQVTYKVDPTWQKGETPRSYLGPDYAFLRGMAFLYTPLTWHDAQGLLRGNDNPGHHAGQASLYFSLPPHWSVTSPWEAENQIPIAALRNTYLGLGPMQVAEVWAGEARLRLGVYAGLGSERSQELIAHTQQLFETMVEATGISPQSVAPAWALTVVPPEPIHGGAAGTSSLISSDELAVISHEMFHWWNGSEIQFTLEAEWIKEGFTKYYEGKMLYAAGIWTEEDFAAHLDRLADRGGGEARHLINASNRLAKTYSRGDYNAVYFGGGLVAYYLDERLADLDLSLDNIWQRLAVLPQPVSSEAFLRELAEWAGQELAQECSDLVYGRRVLLHLLGR